MPAASPIVRLGVAAVITTAALATLWYLDKVGKVAKPAPAGADADHCRATQLRPAAPRYVKARHSRGNDGARAGIGEKRNRHDANARRARAARQAGRSPAAGHTAATAIAAAGGAYTLQLGAFAHPANAQKAVERLH